MALSAIVQLILWYIGNSGSVLLIVFKPYIDPPNVYMLSQSNRNHKNK